MLICNIKCLTSDFLNFSTEQLDFSYTDTMNDTDATKLLLQLLDKLHELKEIHQNLISVL